MKIEVCFSLSYKFKHRWDRLPQPCRRDPGFDPGHIGNSDHKGRGVGSGGSANVLFPGLGAGYTGVKTS